MHTQTPSYKKQSQNNFSNREQVDKNVEKINTLSRDETLTQEPAGVLCGIKPVLELLESEPGKIDEVYLRRGGRIDAGKILDLCRDHRIRFNLCEGRDLDRLVGSGTNHQGVAARLLCTGLIEFSDLIAQISDAPLPLIVALDQVLDPGNVGTLARSLYALGAAGLVVPKHNSAFLGSGARRAAAGALERLPVSRVVNLSRALDEAADAGLMVCGAGQTAHSESVYTAALNFPMLLVLGSEEHGVRDQVGKRCEKHLHIPLLRSFDSLNVAQAGAMIVSECARRYSLI